MGIPAPLGIGADGTPPAYDQANTVVAGVFSAVGPGRPFVVQGPMNVSLWGAINTALTTTGGSLTASVASGSGLAAGQAINSALVLPGTTWATFSGTSGTLALPPLTLWGKTRLGAAQISDLGSTAVLLGAAVSGYGITPGTTVTSIIKAAVAATSSSVSITGIVGLSAPLTADTGPKSQTTLPFVFAPSAASIAAGTDTAASFTGASIAFSGSVNLERSFDGGSTWLVCTVPGSNGTMAVYAAGTPVGMTFSEPEKGVMYRLNCTSLGSGTINYRISATGVAALSVSLGSAF